MSPLALFDLDDTLIDRDAAFRRWATWFAGERGLDTDPGAVAFLCQADGRGYVPRPEMFEAVRTRFSLPDPVPSLVDDYRRRCLTFYRPEPEVQGALGLLRQGGWRVVVVTNGPTLLQPEKVRRAGLEPLVDAVCVSETVGASKPDPAIFSEAVRLAGGAPDDGEVWMAGDSGSNDMAGGRAMGFTTIWVHRGRAWEETAWVPDHQVPDIPAAVAVMVNR